jgi:hypothetical protein
MRSGGGGEGGEESEGGEGGGTVCCTPLSTAPWPTPKTHQHGQLAARIALGITWGGLVSGRGHRKDQFRALGSHSALHANIPRKGGPLGGRGARGPDFFR